MRQPLCGLLLCAVVACATAPAAADTPALTPQAARGAPCAGRHESPAIQDSNCCKVPTFTFAGAALSASQASRAVETALRNDVEGPRK